MIQVVWFKRDLRTVDHRPLAEAAIAGPVLPLYVVEPQYWALPDTSKRQWLVQEAAVQELSRRLSYLGAPLIVRVGQVVDVLGEYRSVVVDELAGGLEQVVDFLDRFGQLLIRGGQ